MNQTEIDELRERIDAAISTVCNGMAAMSIPADPRDVDLVLADCAKALAALEEARAERYTLKEKLAAMDLLLNNAERVVRDGIADRDAAETQAWDALGRPDGTHDTSNVQRLCEAHGALKAKLDQTRDWYADRWARLRAFLAKGSAMEKGACDIMANGHLLADQDRKSAVALATERAEAAEAKLAALVESCEMALDIDSEDISVGAFHDKWRGAPGYGNGDGSREILSKALAAAKEQP